jgi:putative oxidoreductase
VATVIDSVNLDVGLLLVRVAAGGILIAHGLQKLGLFAGPGFTRFAAGFEEGPGFRPGVLWASAVVFAEFVGGLLIVLGFLGPIGPLVGAADMFVAAVVVHAPKGFWNKDGGYEFPALLGLTAVALALTGPGAWSVDGVLALKLPAWLPAVWAVAVFAGAILALAVSSLARSAPPTSGPPSTEAPPATR